MSDQRPLILQHLLPLVPFDGWSEQALSQAAERAAIDPAEAKRLFPGGAGDCMDYFFACENEQLAAEYPENILKELRVPERIETLVLARLKHFAPHKEAVRRAIASRTLPWNAPATFQALYHTVDTMWRLAGDNSIDFSFYTKRATLAGLYSSTLLYDTVDALWHAAGDEATDFSFYTKRATLAGIYAALTLYWLDDRSEGAAASVAFLERRLRELGALPRVRSQLARLAIAVPNPLRFFRLARRRS